MARTRPSYPEEYKRKVVELVRSGRTPYELAKEFEPTVVTIKSWVRQADRDEGKRQDGLPTSELEELRQTPPPSWPPRR